MFRHAIVSSFLLVSAAAYADPGPGPAAKNLACLVGTWHGTGTLTMGTQKMALQLEMRCEPAAGGFGVTCDDVITGIPGMDAYRERDLWGVNAGDGTIHWFAITSGGEAHDHHGTLDKDGFVGQFVGRRDGKKFVEKVSLAFTGERAFHGSSQAYENGVAAERMTFEVVKTDGRRAGR
jgi:hypothetical protein